MAGKWFSASPHQLSQFPLVLQHIQPPAPSSPPNGPFGHGTTVMAMSPHFPWADRAQPQWDRPGRSPCSAVGRLLCREQPKVLGAAAEPAKVTPTSPCGWG